MEFTLPTTKQEMYDTLNDIFYYYRIKRQSYSELSLQELDLERLAYVPETDDELLARATILVAPDQEREIVKLKMELQEDIETIQIKIQAVENSIDSQIEAVNELYEGSKLTVVKQSEKNGLIVSGVIVDRFAVLEAWKDEKILKIEQDAEAEINTLTAELTAKQNTLDGLEQTFEQAHANDVEKKLSELKIERQNKSEEVFKYNNGLDEKEQRYKNTIIQANAALELKFLEISSGDFSKDQLIEMGYYEDVIKCVCGYLDTLAVGTAYQLANSDQKLPVYLDDYYQNIVYMYQAKAGL